MLGAAPVKMAPTAKMMAAMIITVFLPRISVIRPLRAAPSTAPISTAVVTHSSWESLIPHPPASCRKFCAPEITPVSNPNKSPPVAAIVAIVITRFLLLLLLEVIMFL
jgi:hypothetical protein